MSATADDRLYKRKINEFEQDLKRLQKELAKLKVLRRAGGRARKDMMKTMNRELELQAMLEEEQIAQFEDLHQKANTRQERAECCKRCQSNALNIIEAGTRTIIVCLDCETRYTKVNDKDHT